MSFFVFIRFVSLKIFIDKSNHFNFKYTSSQYIVALDSSDINFWFYVNWLDAGFFLSNALALHLRKTLRLIKISFPKNSLKIRTEEGRYMVFDELRKKWLQLTPEEWVRQNFIQYLIQIMQYPAALITVEKEIRLGELRKRFDIVVFKRDMSPWMIIECKEMNVELSYKTIDQIISYQMALPSEHLVITNGSFTYAFKKYNGRFVETSHLPQYPVE